ncbi:GNAT family N-acetyltransferase [Kitasatospora brasiliensis]|uniref:GNAT family N-acetyltransferase n=1 Tax=Kitasatospora brasiliensis TaxID=3058040 RepID=UPI00292CAA5F|nr:GNAT family N-acetyltransferase [Kitasatospora sp. K002]
MTEPRLKISVLRGTTVAAEEVAALTRAAYRMSDPLPGLPVPDGAGDTAGSVLADLARGTVVWLARDALGEPVGALRLRESADGAWEISRIAVAPAARGGGVARALVSAVEHAALRSGPTVLRLDAVVERCLPTLYDRLGFRTVRHWPAEDKPLTEVTMERHPGTPVEPQLLPWAPPESGNTALAVLWLVTSDALLAVVGDTHDCWATAAAVPGARLAGVDLHRGPGSHDRDALLARLAAHGLRPGVTAVASPAERGAVRAHLMPRTVDPGLYAHVRLAPAAELPMHLVGPRTAVRPLAV